MSNPSVNPDPYSTAPAVNVPSDPAPVGTYSGTTYASPQTSGPAGDGGRFSDESSTADVAKSEAGGVKDAAVEAGSHVVQTAKTEAANVAAEAKQQAKGLLDTATSELREQAGSQQSRAASALHALAKELGGMASASPESGPLTDLAQQASRKGGEIAHWLENHEPTDVLREVSSFARRRPVMFLALCGAAGVVAGRLTRGAVAVNTSVDSTSPSTSSPALSAATTPQPAQAPVDYLAPGTGTFPGSVPTGAAAGGYGTPLTSDAVADPYAAPANPYAQTYNDPNRPGGAASGWTDVNR